MKNWFLFIFFLCLVPVFLHIPIFKLNKKDIEMIKTLGLIHFTSNENALKIKTDGFKGSVSHMGGIERLLGNLIWFYINTPDQKQKQKILFNTSRGKKDKKRFEVCIIVNDLNDEDIKKMRKRIGFSKKDKAIVYKGDKFIPKKMIIGK